MMLETIVLEIMVRRSRNLVYRGETISILLLYDNRSARSEDVKSANRLVDHSNSYLTSSHITSCSTQGRHMTDTGLLHRTEVTVVTR